MRTLAIHQSSAKRLEETTSLPIEPSSKLSITITINTKQNKRQPTTYRPIKRADGVIVEYPRYRPSTSIFPPSTALERQPATTHLLSVAGKSKMEQGKKRMERDVFGMRTFSDELCRQYGRDGYNSPLELPEAKRGVEEQVLMRRFMEDEAPWTTYSRRT